MQQPMEIRTRPPLNGRGNWSVIIREQIGNEVYVGRGVGSTYLDALANARNALNGRVERQAAREARRNPIGG